MFSVAYSFRRLRRLAQRPGPVSFLEFVRAHPVQCPTFVAMEAAGDLREDASSHIWYEKYVRWCIKNGKTPEAFRVLILNY